LLLAGHWVYPCEEKSNDQRQKAKVEMHKERMPPRFGHQKIDEWHPQLFGILRTCGMERPPQRERRGHKERETKKAAPSVDARTLSKRYAKAVAM
jgi:hypothetical protein